MILAGRPIADMVTSLGSSGDVDDAVLRIDRAYDDIGRLQTVTSYDTDDPQTSADVVNQILYVYLCPCQLAGVDILWSGYRRGSRGTGWWSFLHRSIAA